jgi:hypothetical protein
MRGDQLRGAFDRPRIRERRAAELPDLERRVMTQGAILAAGSGIRDPGIRRFAIRGIRD